MSVLDAAAPLEEKEGLRPHPLVNPSSFFDIAGSSASTAFQQWNKSVEDQKARTRFTIAKRYREATGKKLSEFLDHTVPNSKQSLGLDKVGIPGDEPLTRFGDQFKNFLGMNDNAGLDYSEDQYKKIDDAIFNLRETQPERFKDLETFSEADQRIVREFREKQTEEERQQSLRLEGVGGLSGAAASLAGGLLGGLADPLNLIGGAAAAKATAPLLRSSYSTLKNIRNIMLVEGTTNSMVELAQTPNYKRWNEHLNRKYGLDDIATNALLAFVGGAGLSGLGAGAGRVLSKTKFDEMIAGAELSNLSRLDKIQQESLWRELQGTLEGKAATADFDKAMSDRLNNSFKTIKDVYESPMFDKPSDLTDYVEATYRTTKESHLLNITSQRTEELVSRIINKSERGEFSVKDPDTMEFLIRSANNLKEGEPPTGLASTFSNQLNRIKSLRIEDVPSYLLEKVSTTKEGRNFTQLERVFLEATGIDSHGDYLDAVQKEIKKRVKAGDYDKTPVDLPKVLDDLLDVDVNLLPVKDALGDKVIKADELRPNLESPEAYLHSLWMKEFSDVEEISKEFNENLVQAVDNFDKQTTGEVMEASFNELETLTPDELSAAQQAGLDIESLKLQAVEDSNLMKSITLCSGGG